MSDIRLFIDRVEEKTAVLYSIESAIRIELPAEFLPGGIKEGDIIVAAFKKDKASSTALKQAIIDIKRRIDQV